MDTANTDVPSLRSETGTEGVARACPYCDAGPPPGRLGLRAVGALVGQHLRLERGLLHTLVDMCLRPGEALDAYYAGRRRREYVNPVTYLLLAAASSLLVMPAYREGFRQALLGDVRARLQGGDSAPLRALGADDAFLATYLDVMLGVMETTSVTSMMLMLPMAVLAWLLLGGPRFNLAEALVFSLYATGTALFLHSLLVTPVLAAGAWTLGQYGGVALYLALPVWMGIARFGRAPATVAKVGTAVVGGYVVGSIATQVLVVALVLVRMRG